jgi:hypothetical protein
VVIISTDCGADARVWEESRCCRPVVRVRGGEAGCTMTSAGWRVEAPTAERAGSVLVSSGMVEAEGFGGWRLDNVRGLGVTGFRADCMAACMVASFARNWRKLWLTRSSVMGPPARAPTVGLKRGVEVTNKWLRLHRSRQIKEERVRAAEVNGQPTRRLRVRAYPVIS